MSKKLFNKPIIDKQVHDLYQSLEAHIHKKLWFHCWMIENEHRLTFCVLGPSNKRG